ncbi:MAG: type II toxin-antitoxin system RelE family toxin [Candidatus Limnocylindrales bacterium]
MKQRPRYRVEFAPAAQREFRRLAAVDGSRLRAPILALAREPRPPGVVKLSGTDFWRLRVGELRLVYVIDEGARRVVILRVARRSERTNRHMREGR